jgi:hypothetical protein
LIQFPIHFEIIVDIEHVETLALGGKIRDIMRLQKQFDPGRWRKLKGVTKVRLKSGRICNAVVHWHEEHGIDRKKMKIKKLFDEEHERGTKRDDVCTLH